MACLCWTRRMRSTPVFFFSAALGDSSAKVFFFFLFFFTFRFCRWVAIVPVISLLIEVTNDRDVESVLATERIRLHRQTLHFASTVEVPAGCGYEMKITGGSSVYRHRDEGAKEGWGVLIRLTVDKVVGPGDMDHDWGVSECLHWGRSMTIQTLRGYYK